MEYFIRAPWRAVTWIHAPDLMWVVAVTVALIAVWVVRLLRGDSDERRLGSLLAVLLLLGVSLNAKLAGTVFYARPTAGGPYGVANGTSYANAWSGFAAVTGLSAGDTLKSCGDFVAADADSGGSGAFRNQDVAGERTTGDCSAEGGASESNWYLSGSGKSYGILCNTAALCQDSQWASIHVHDAPIRGFYIRNDLNDTDIVNFTGTDLSCTDTIGTEGSAPWCVAGWGANATLTSITSTRSTDDSVHWQGADVTVQYSHFYNPGYNIAAGSFIGDCVQIITQTARAKIHHNYCDKRNANADGNVSKSCWIIGDPASAGGGEISDNECWLPKTGNSTFESKSILSSGDDVKILRNFVSGGYYGIFAFGANNTVVGNVVVDAEYRGIEIPTVTASGTTLVANNTVIGSPIGYILKGASAAVTVNAYNNVAHNQSTYGYEKVSATYNQSNNRCSGSTPTCSNNAGTISTVSDPGFTGGLTPTNVDGFCLDTDSPLIGAGTYLGAWATGYNNEDLGKPPAIGARGTCYGRPLVTSRPAVTSRPSN